MKFKKIYIEITNICNLQCSFCIKDNRKKQQMTKDEFEQVIKKIDKYTDYIYLHVKGEPLIHNELDEILFITKKYNKKVNITTNGVYLKEKVDILKKYDNIRQINISLHSEHSKINYIEDIIDSISDLKDKYIVFRFWTLKDNKIDDKFKIYLEKIKKVYNVSNDIYDKILIEKNIKISNNIYISKDEEFIWPDINNNYYSEFGYCLGLKTHIGILVDGTVIVCCLDSFGESNLGNIFNSSLDEILESDKVKKISKGFNDRKLYLELCKHCSYKERFK